MSSYSPDLGFTPSTFEELSQRFYELTLQYIPHSMSYEEYLESDLYLIFQGVIQLKFDDDLLFSELINEFFSYIDDANFKITTARSNTYSGLYQSLIAISDFVYFITKQEDQQLVPGELVIVLENPNLELIDDVMLNNLGVSVSTNPALTTYPPDNQRSFTLNNQQVVDYWYLAGTVMDTFFVNIRYRRLDGVVAQPNEIEFIQQTFLDEFNAVMGIGTKFEPERYVSTQNVPYVADFEVGYKLTEESTSYVYEPYQPAYDTRLKLTLGHITVLGDLT